MKTKKRETMQKILNLRKALKSFEREHEDGILIRKLHNCLDHSFDNWEIAEYYFTKSKMAISDYVTGILKKDPSTDVSLYMELERMY